LIGGTHTSRPEAGQEIEVVVIRAVAPPTAVLGMGHPDVCDEGEILIDPSRLEDVEHAARSGTPNSRPSGCDLRSGSRRTIDKATD
jgi:hypothetical protein